MKRLLFMLAAAMLTLCSNVQKLSEKNVPAAVKSAFQKMQPDAKKVMWEKEHGNFEAEFEVGETEHSVVFDKAGNMLETEMEITVNELPAMVKDYVSKNYSGQKIKEASKITDAKGTVTYEAEVGEKDLIFDSNGNFIKVEKEEKKDDKD